MKPISLKKVVDELEVVSDDIAVYISTKTGNMVAVTEDLEILRIKLLDLIRGSGAFRRFKNFIDHKGIVKDWYAFRESALKEIASEFLEEANIPFTDDCASTK